MKSKIISILLTVVLVLTTSVCISAEETEEDNNRFEIRDGIYLGDDYDSVIEKEQNDLGFEEDDLSYKVGYEEGDDEFCNLWSKEGKIAGVEGSSIHFYFKNRKLDEVVLHLGDCGDKDSLGEEYSQLCETLEKKYGKKLDNQFGETFIITSSNLHSQFSMANLFNGEVVDYDEWIYDECNDYNVKVDIISYYYKLDGMEYHNDISYKMFYEDEATSIVEQKREEKEEKEKGMDEDL